MCPSVIPPHTLLKKHLSAHHQSIDDLNSSKLYFYFLCRSSKMAATLKKFSRLLLRNRKWYRHGIFTIGFSLPCICSHLKNVVYDIQNGRRGVICKTGQISKFLKILTQLTIWVPRVNFTLLSFSFQNGFSKRSHGPLDVQTDFGSFSRSSKIQHGRYCSHFEFL